MEANVPQVTIAKPSSTDNIIAESKVKFKFEKFTEYKNGEKISESILTQENLKCFIKLNVDEYGSKKDHLIVDIDGFNEIFWKSKPHHLKVIASIKDWVFADSGLKTISQQVVWDVLNTYIDHSSLKERLEADGSLILVISVKIFGARSSPLKKFIKLNNYFEVAELNSKIFESGSYSDFTFIVQQQNFKVHRNILAAASPVFDKMFSNGMAESKSGQCDVKDIEPHIFKHLLEFIYTAKVPNDISDVAKELFEAAHYYEIETLKEICKNELPRKLTVKNAMETYKLAWTYDLEELKLAAWKIIKNNIIREYTLEDEKMPTVDFIQEILACKNKLQDLYREVNNLDVPPSLKRPRNQLHRFW